MGPFFCPFQLTHVYGLQGHGINPSSCFALRICFRKLHPRDAPSRSTQVRFAQIMVSCWTYFLPGFCRAVPVISTSALLSLGRSKRTRLCCYPILRRGFLIERNSHIHGWLGLIEDEDVGTRVFDNFNLPMYTDCKLLVLRSLNFNSPMYTDCKLGRSKRTR